MPLRTLLAGKMKKVETTKEEGQNNQESENPKHKNTIKWVWQSSSKNPFQLDSFWPSTLDIEGAA